MVFGLKGDLNSLLEGIRYCVSTCLHSRVVVLQAVSKGSLTKRTSVVWLEVFLDACEVSCVQC